MIYIEKRYRDLFDNALKNLPIPTHKGSLEYVIFKIMRMYMNDGMKEWNYTNLHDTVYAVQHCADEFRRRFLGPKEEAIKASNGDVGGGFDS